MNQLIIQPIDLNSTRIIIVNKNSKLSRSVLMFMLILIYGFPISMGTILATDGNPDNNNFVLGLTFMLILFLLVSRVFFWGLWGKENILINHQRGLEFHYDYKIWKSKPTGKEFDFKTIRIEEIEKTKKGEIGKIRFGSKEDNYLSVLKVPLDSVEELKEKLNVEIKEIRSDEN